MSKLKKEYARKEDIPEAYVERDGKWVMNDLDDSHPLIVNKASLETEQTKLNQKIQGFDAEKGNLERERDEFKGKAVQNGYRAVTIEIADLGNAAKAANLSKDELPTLKEKVTDFETKETEKTRREDLTKAFKFAEVTNLDEAFSRKATDGLKIEWKTVDNVSKPYVIGEKDGQKTETLFDKNYLSTAEGFASGAAALYSAPKTGFEFPGETKGNPPANEWDAYRAEGKAVAAQEAPKPTSNIFAQASK